MKILLDIIGALLISISTFIIMNKLLDIKTKSIGWYKILIMLILITIYLLISYFSTMNFLRYLMFIIVVSLIYVLFTKSQLKNCIVAVFITWVLIAISELIFAFFALSLFKIDKESLYGGIIGNFSISLIMVILIKIKYIYNVSKKLMNKIFDSNKKYIISMIFVLAFSISIIIYINYFNVSNNIRFLLTFFVIIINTAFLLLLFKERENYSKIQYQYENAIKNLEEYEKMLDYQRVANHENKNQLLVIKGMVRKKEKGIADYIDSIVKEKREDNEDFYMKTKRIPSGGLQGLMYYKLLTMKEKNINISLNITSSVRKINLEKENISINKDLCKIMGVILDNAIQATQNLKRKDIDISMNVENDDLIILVSNNFNGEVDFSQMDEIGYSTKGKGHGYGLSLVKQIIDKNENIENYKMINGNNFTQKIILHCKKNK